MQLFPHHQHWQLKSSVQSFRALSALSSLSSTDYSSPVGAPTPIDGRPGSVAATARRTPGKERMPADRHASSARNPPAKPIMPAWSAIIKRPAHALGSFDFKLSRPCLPYSVARPDTAVRLTISFYADLSLLFCAGIHGI